MRKIIAIAWKDTKLRFASPIEWLFFLILPVVFTVVLAGGTGGSGDGRVRVVVVDQANTALSAQLITALGNSEAIRPDIQPLATAENQFSKRQVSALLIIPASFDLQHLEGGSVPLELRQLPNNINALVVSQALNATVSRISSTIDIANRSVAVAEAIKPFASAADRQAYFDASLQLAQSQISSAPQRATVVEGSAQNQVTYDPRANSSAGQLITWVFIPLIGISALFAYERQKGTLRRLLISPTSRATFLLGTILGQVVIALGQMLLLVGFGVLVMKINWGRDPVALAVMLVGSALVAAALGTLLGTFVRTEGQANGISILFGMVMALLGGCWYPIELFPQAVRSAAHILPTTWAMEGMLDIVLRGQGVAGILLPAGVLLGFAALFFGVGILRFRYE